MKPPMLDRKMCAWLAEIGLPQGLFVGDWCYAPGQPNPALVTVDTAVSLPLSACVKIPSPDELEALARVKARKRFGDDNWSLIVETFPDNSVGVAIEDSGVNFFVDADSTGGADLSKSLALISLIRKIVEMK